MEVEDRCGLSDLPVDLLWDHPTIDALSEALWRLMQAPSTFGRSAMAADGSGGEPHP
jgi:hypothetical protein